MIDPSNPPMPFALTRIHFSILHGMNFTTVSPAFLPAVGETTSASPAKCIPTAGANDAIYVAGASVPVPAANKSCL